MNHDYFSDLYFIDINGDRVNRVKNKSMVLDQDNERTITQKFESIFASPSDQGTTSKVKAEAWSIPVERDLVPVSSSRKAEAKVVSVPAWEIPSAETERVTRHVRRQPGLSQRLSTQSLAAIEADADHPAPPSSSAVHYVSTMISSNTDPSPARGRPSIAAEVKSNLTSPAAIRTTAASTDSAPASSPWKAPRMRKASACRP